MQAFADIFEEYRPVVYAVACRITGPDDADDVVIESFLKAWRALPNFDARSSLKTWLYRITHNCALDFLRKRKRRREKTMPEDEHDDRRISQLEDEQQPRADENIMRDELAEMIYRALDCMDKPHRDVLLLRFVDGLSYADIAEAMDLSIGTVMSRLFNGRRKLRTMINEME